ncbi:substrate-binding periplasmic protein [Halobacteriovorax sp.]|uniref:substrate-binding periplasmic protein n=1 Tax=Halobacteriovorax sp. TaxID=2020862 RepID=UPI00356A76C7
MKQIIISLLLSLNSYALDKIYLDSPPSGDFSRRGYASELLTLSLEKTKKKYGPYEISHKEKMSRDRALREMQTGTINVYDAPTRNEWEEATIPIFIPLTKGLLSYRLLLIKEKDRFKFSNVKEVDDLINLKAGLGSQWSTTQVLKAIGGFQIVEGSSYEGLFTMLNAGRFDYFIRGVNEIFGEYENIKEKFEEIIIEQSLLLYIPMPMYFFVSKKHPELAKRIEEGLIIAINDGSFNETFLKHHKENIMKVDFKNRVFLNIGNPIYNKNIKYFGTKFWLDLESLRSIK